MTDATLYRAAGSSPVLVATIEAVTRYDVARPLLGAIHEPPVAFGSAIHRQALPFGTREGELELVLGGPSAAARADAIDEALKLNGLYYLDIAHFPQLHGVRWAVNAAYSIHFDPAPGRRRTWIVTVPIKEVLT